MAEQAVMTDSSAGHAMQGCRNVHAHVLPSVQTLSRSTVNVIIADEAVPSRNAGKEV